MRQRTARRIRSLCERVAAFIEANDSLAHGPITPYGPDTISWSKHIEGVRSAWTIDRYGRKWVLLLTRHMTEANPLGTDTIEQVTVLNVRNYEPRLTEPGLLPSITLRLDAYPEHRDAQRHARRALWDNTLPVQRKYAFQRESNRSKGEQIAHDAWTSNDEVLIVVEFSISAVEALVDEIMRGTVVRNERTLAFIRERKEHEACVHAACKKIVVLTEQERAALGAELIHIGTVSDEWEYRGATMADTSDWESDAYIRLQRSLIYEAAKRDAELVAVGPTSEAGGLVTSVLAQTMTMFKWRDTKHGPKRLAEIRMRAIGARMPYPWMAWQAPSAA